MTAPLKTCRRRGRSERPRWRAEPISERHGGAPPAGRGGVPQRGACAFMRGRSKHARRFLLFPSTHPDEPILSGCSFSAVIDSGRPTI
eukprot:6027544-Pyramimonas_sp.AAC.1